MVERRRAAPAGRSRRPADFPSSRHATKTAGRRLRRREPKREKLAPGGLTRMERRAVQERRRTRTLLVGSAALAALVLVAWFPGGSLLQQHSALAATDSALSTLRHQDAALALEQKKLDTPSEIERIAREQYDLVLPGQAAFQVLPPNGSATGADAPYPGDPGLSAPVTPSGTSELSGSGLSLSTPAVVHHAHSGRPAHAAVAAAEGGGVFSRIVRALEFWR